MIQGIYKSAAATDGLQAWNDVIARNLAASMTPGFKKETFTFDGVASGTIDFGSDRARPSTQSSLSPVAHGHVSFQNGEVRGTGDSHDFAIQGAGFFRLQAPNGDYVYTRDGQFNVSPDGQLVSKQGFPVAGDSGPIQLLPDGGPLSVDAEGRVRQGTQEVGVLSVFEFDDHSSLKRTQGGFVPDPASRQEPHIAEGSRVKQGFIEMSNVSAMHEMVDLITVSNALQANQKVIQSYDASMERAVQTLGSTS